MKNLITEQEVEKERINKERKRRKPYEDNEDDDIWESKETRDKVKDRTPSGKFILCRECSNNLKDYEFKCRCHGKTFEGANYFESRSLL
jgi:hypothetical protein